MLLLRCHLQTQMNRPKHNIYFDNQSWIKMNGTKKIHITILSAYGAQGTDAYPCSLFQLLWLPWTFYFSPTRCGYQQSRMHEEAMICFGPHLFVRNSRNDALISELSLQFCCTTVGSSTRQFFTISQHQKLDACLTLPLLVLLRSWEKEFLFT